MTQRHSPSPNHDARAPGPVDMVIVLYTGMTGGQAALDRLRDPAAKVSAHYLIDEDGTVHAMVPEDRRAWHAGVSFWSGERDVNSRSIGIELVNPGHEHGYRDFPPAQMRALIDLLDGIRARHPVPPSRVIGHSDIAPARKDDPGERFDWAMLAAAGHAIVPRPAPADRRPAAPGEAGRLLGRIGYDWPADAAGQAAVLRAFQRRCRPSRIDGQADEETMAQLRGLCRAAGIDPEPPKPPRP